MLKCREYHKESEQGKAIGSFRKHYFKIWSTFLGGHFVHSEYWKTSYNTDLEMVQEKTVTFLI